MYGSIGNTAASAGVLSIPAVTLAGTPWLILGSVLLISLGTAIGRFIPRKQR